MKQMAGVMMEAIPSFYAKRSEKKLFNSGITDEKNLWVTKFAWPTTMMRWTWTPTQFQLSLLRDVAELLQKSYAFCITFQYVVVYTQSSSFHQWQNFWQEWTNVWYCAEFIVSLWTKQRRVQKARHHEKKSLEEKVQKALIEFFSKKLRQTSGSMFAETTEQLEKTTVELKVIKVVNCLLKSYIKSTSNLVTFNIKFY